MKIAAINSTPAFSGFFWRKAEQQKPERHKNYVFYNDDTPCVVSCNLNSDGLRILPFAQEIARRGVVVNAQKYMDNVKTMEKYFQRITPASKTESKGAAIRKAEYALDGNTYILERSLRKDEEEPAIVSLYSFKAEVFDEEDEHFCSYERVKTPDSNSTFFQMSDPEYGNITLSEDSRTEQTYFSIVNPQKQYRIKGHYAEDPESIEYTQLEKYCAAST